MRSWGGFRIENKYRFLPGFYGEGNKKNRFNAFKTRFKKIASG
jgi:hypothetical protein